MRDSKGSDSNDGENNHAGEGNPTRVQHSGKRKNIDRTVIPTNDRNSSPRKSMGQRGQRAENSNGQSAIPTISGVALLTRTQDCCIYCIYVIPFRYNRKGHI